MSWQSDESIEVRVARGKWAEERFFTICQWALYGGAFPDWFVGVERGSAHDDHRGADFWAITTDTEPMRIDVKSSEGTAKTHRRKLKKSGAWRKQRRGLVITSIVSVHTVDSEIYTILRKKVESQRKQILHNRAHRAKAMAQKSKT